MSSIPFQDYPINSVLSQVNEALATAPNLVLTAPTGSGKSTLLPLALLEQPWLGGQRILMLEPRRLAARACARRMAQLLGEPLGETVGYQVRFERKVSSITRIEVVTEGILTRRLQQDPTLDGVGLVIFDEFHERNLHSDLGLALCLDLQRALNESLRLMVMSATLECEPLCRLLDGARLIRAQGRTFPVEIRYQQRISQDSDLLRIERGIRRAIVETREDILAFLPGAGEIRRLEERLADVENLLVVPLYGDLSSQAQDRALHPSPDGHRRLVLATSIAETSLTIEGIGCVVDSGLQRLPEFDANSGLTRLRTRPVSLSSAQQRSGRAGRMGPGVCYRLWTESQQRRLPAHNPAGILTADLAPLALELALWGVRDPAQLSWLDAPPAGHWRQAIELLQQLGALDGSGRVTPDGRDMAALGVHPRLARLLLKAQEVGQEGVGCDLAALLSERDPLRVAGESSPGADIEQRLHLLERWRERTGAGRDALSRALQRIDRASRQWRKWLGTRSRDDSGKFSAGALLSFAYPERIAQCRGEGGTGYRMANGRGASLDRSDSLAGEPLLVLASLDAGTGDGRIYLAAPITLEEVKYCHAGRLESHDRVFWDGDEKAVACRREERLGALALTRSRLADVDPEQRLKMMIEGIRQMGVGCLPWTPELEQFRIRVICLRQWQPEAGWPDFSDQGLLDTLEEWLGPWLLEVGRASQLRRIPLKQALESYLGWPQLQRLQQLAPERIEVPSGSRIRLRYSCDGPPVLAARLQELFGLAQTPRICAGGVAVLVHLLSPAQRPVQVTQDLAGFWRNTYHEVRKELKGRYPKHYWPDDPLSAVATARLRPTRG